LLRRQLIALTQYAWPTEAPQEWASFIPTVVARLQQAMAASPPNLLHIYGCVCMLRAVMSRYEARIPEKRQPLFDMIDACMPLLLHILQRLTALGANGTDETRAIFHHCSAFSRSF
jgi:hypothetical protein